MQRRVFEVSDIHCAGCTRTIDTALSEIHGVERVNADPATNLVEVAFDEQRVTVGQVADALAAAGFPVREISEGRAVPPETAGVDAPRTPARGRYALLVAAVAVIAVAGYTGYVLYPRFDLPAVQGAGLLGLAAAAGIASFFSPCSFPLLVGLLGRQATQQAHGQTAGRPVVFGGALALGAAAFMLLAGLVIAAGGEALFAGVTFTSIAGITIRSIIGVLLVALGLMQIGVLRGPFHGVERLTQPLARRQARLRREHPVAGFGLFGFSYVLAGFG